MSTFSRELIKAVCETPKKPVVLYTTPEGSNHGLIVGFTPDLCRPDLQIKSMNGCSYVSTITFNSEIRLGKRTKAYPGLNMEFVDGTTQTIIFDGSADYDLNRFAIIDPAILCRK